jgi:hypothetical protein
MLKRNKLTFEGHFTQIPNKWVRDDRLSYKARGILAILMSHEIGWRTSQQQLQTDLDKRKSVSSAIQELELFGYLIREQGHDEAGRFQEVEWILSDPFETPNALKPQADEVRAEKEQTKNTNYKEQQTKETKVAQSETDQRFLDFWNAYPHRPKDNKKRARLIFGRLKANEQASALAGAIVFAQDPDLPTDRQFIPMAATWLHQERWNDIDEKPVAKVEDEAEWG